MKDARREMPKMLPNGWVQTRLGDVCLPVPSLRPEDSPSTEFTYFDIGGIDNRTNQISEPKMLLGRNAPGRARQAVQNGDILFSTVRTYLKNIARVDRDYPNPVASTGFTVLRPADGISSDFLFLANSFRRLSRTAQRTPNRGQLSCRPGPGCVGAADFLGPFPGAAAHCRETKHRSNRRGAGRNRC